MPAGFGDADAVKAALVDADFPAGKDELVRYPEASRADEPTITALHDSASTRWMGVALLGCVAGVRASCTPPAQPLRSNTATAGTTRSIRSPLRQSDAAESRPVPCNESAISGSAGSRR